MVCFSGSPHLVGGTVACLEFDEKSKVIIGYTSFFLSFVMIISVCVN